MAKLIFGMNQSLDGYVDYQAFAPGPGLFQHFIEEVGGLAGSLYGRRLYEIMRYWDEDQAGWGPAEHEFARAWRAQPKWVASRSLKTVGPNATLIQGDLGDFARRLKAEHRGEIGVGGPVLAASLTALGLIDSIGCMSIRRCWARAIRSSPGCAPRYGWWRTSGSARRRSG
jgi:hypothetical protein